MLKKLLFIFPLFLTSCSLFWHEDGSPLCPYVTIPQDKSYAVQTAGYMDTFQIDLIGYEGYCYDESSVNRKYAVITPIFSVTRLQNSDETAVDFSFYTETVKGPPGFLGKKSYNVSAAIGLNEKNKEVKSRPVKVKIPSDGTPLEIFLALDVSLEEYNYNQRTFDVLAEQKISGKEVLIEEEGKRVKNETSCRQCGI